MWFHHAPTWKPSATAKNAEAGHRIQTTDVATSVVPGQQQVRRLQMHGALVRVMEPVKMAKFVSALWGQFQQMYLAHELGQFAVSMDEHSVGQRFRRSHNVSPDGRRNDLGGKRVGASSDSCSRPARTPGFASAGGTTFSVWSSGIGCTSLRREEGSK